MEFKKEYCSKLIEHMSEGLSYESFAGTIGVHRDTLYQWDREYPEFLESKKIGKEKLLLFFERLGRAGMSGKIEGFDSKIFTLTVKNHLGWSDKKDLSKLLI